MTRKVNRYSRQIVRPMPPLNNAQDNIRVETNVENVPENISINCDENSQTFDEISYSSKNNIDLGSNKNDCEKSIISTNSNDEILERESKMTKEEIDTYLINLYETVSAESFTNETLSSISSIVRNNVVRKVKFIDNEHTSGLSREAIEECRNYPSFWKPNLSNKNSLQNDILNEFPNLKQATLHKKVKAWMGMRERVRDAIRGHRNQVQTAIQGSIVAGKYF